MILTRKQLLEELLANEPAYRKKQTEAGLFQEQAQSWDSIQSLPASLRASLTTTIPWITVKEVAIFSSKDGRTNKAILELSDSLRIESVLMKNARAKGDGADERRYTICVSSQVGCAMRCTFCATGKMGLSRHLTTDEIVDQYRFWCAFLEARGEQRSSIVNIVFMGMGEPLQNYEAVRDTCSTLLAFTKLGPTHIVVSTVGVRHSMEKLLTDPSWPPVRIAISLHSAIEETRKKIVPSHIPGFLKFLQDWAKEYHKKFPEKRRHLSLEYVLLKNVNDDEKNAEALCAFAGHMGKVKVNLIFWNPVAGADFTRSIPEAALNMQKLLKDHDILCTIRDTQGQDIDAACGQLIVESNKKTTKAE